VLKNIESKTPASPRSLNARVDTGLEAICAKAMSKQPGRRYSSAQVLADKLDEWIELRVKKSTTHAPKTILNFLSGRFLGPLSQGNG
jgi:hypothetical protein